MRNYLFERAVVIKTPPKKKRKRKILLCGILGAVILCAIVILLTEPWVRFEFEVGGTADGNVPGTNLPDAGGGSAVPEEPLISRAPAGSGTKLTITDRKGDALTASEVYERTLPSVVSIQAYFDKYLSTGSGIVMSSDGYILTNYHIIEGAEEAEVSLLSDGRVFAAKLVGWEADLDLAVVKARYPDVVPYGIDNTPAK